MERLQDSFFRALFHSPVTGIAVVDLEGLVVLDANEIMLKILGRSSDQLINVPGIFAQITPPEYAEQNAQAFQQALDRGYSDPLVKHYVRPDGTLVPVRTIFGTVPDYSNRLVVFASDVTEEWKPARGRGRPRNAAEYRRVGSTAGSVGLQSGNR